MAANRLTKSERLIVAAVLVLTLALVVAFAARNLAADGSVFPAEPDPVESQDFLP